MKPLSIMLIAGDPSGDMLAVKLVGVLREKVVAGLKHVLVDVPPIQGGEILLGRFSWGFTPGYNMTDFQPGTGGALGSVMKFFGIEILGAKSRRIVMNCLRRLRPNDAPRSRLKARHVIAQAEGLGGSSPEIHEAL